MGHEQRQTLKPSPSAAALPLIDEYQAHLKYAGREPRTLTELAIARADYEHRRRLAEVKSIAPKLALLEALLPALAERGIRLNRRDISTHDGGKTLRVQPSFCGRDDALLAALLDLGFREIERREWSSRDATVKLQHGRWLILSIDVSPPAPPAAAIQAEAPTSQVPA